MKKLTWMLAPIVLLNSGCATLFSDDVQLINVIPVNGKTSTITLDGTQYPVPGLIPVTRSKATKLLISNDNHCPPLTIIPRSVDPLFIANVISGVFGSFGSTTDYHSEKVWRYDNVVPLYCTN